MNPSLQPFVSISLLKGKHPGRPHFPLPRDFIAFMFVLEKIHFFSLRFESGFPALNDFGLLLLSSPSSYLPV